MKKEMEKQQGNDAQKKIKSREKNLTTDGVSMLRR